MSVENDAKRLSKKYLVLNDIIAVDNNGLLHAMYVTTADFTDKNGAIDMLKNTMRIYLKFKTFLWMLGTKEKNLLVLYSKF